jgi:hypothetical protein
LEAKQEAPEQSPDDPDDQVAQSARRMGAATLGVIERDVPAPQVRRVVLPNQPGRLGSADGI